MEKNLEFPFITDVILRENLQIYAEYLTELLPLSDSSGYPAKTQSSFRKDIIIHTASIIEALLFWMLKTKKTEEELAKKKNTFKITKIIYEINPSERIVLGKDKEVIEPCKFEKLNLDQVNALCKEHNLISKDLYAQVNKVRQLRNRLHIATLRILEQDYAKRDLEFVFSVARNVKNAAREIR